MSPTYASFNLTAVSNLLLSNVSLMSNSSSAVIATGGSTDNGFSDVQAKGPLSPRRDPLYVVIPITLVYVLIFFSGIVGNISTCVVISKNKYMHTATNYYLFSLAISDLLLLISGLPPEMYQIWSKAYIFGEPFCIIRGLAAETSANATVLTITAFTVERYVAICHPLRSHTMSKLSRAVRYVLSIWILALLLAVPQAIQFGVVYETDKTSDLTTGQCTVKRIILQHAFEISTFLFFVMPMTLITVMYVFIALKLRGSTHIARRVSGMASEGAEDRRAAAQNHVIKMLVAVVVAFFICWAPFHAQRLLAIYGHNSKQTNKLFIAIYNILTYVSGILYYVSTTINPILYHIMSHKFREAFKDTLARLCGWPKSHQRRCYSVLSRSMRMQMHHQPFQDGSESSNHREGYFCSSRQGTLNNHRAANHRRTPSVDRVLPGEASPAPLTPNGQQGEAILSNGKQLRLFVPRNKMSGKVSQRRAASNRAKKKKKKKKSQLSILRKLRASRMSKSDPEGAEDSSPPCLVREPVARMQSMDSTRSTNTISNSSLQDLDQTEFNSEELANYMGVLNERHSR